MLFSVWDVHQHLQKGLPGLTGFLIQIAAFEKERLFKEIGPLRVQTDGRQTLGRDQNLC